MTSKLLPCPFCGGKAKYASYRTSEDSEACQVSCGSCDARTNEFEDAYAPSEDAFDAWNRRSSPPAPTHNVIGAWLPIERADKAITDVQEFSEVGMTIKMSDRYWVRDDDGRVYEAAWSEGHNGRNYWWDFEGESPVDPVGFMPHPLDPRFQPSSLESCS